MPWRMFISIGKAIETWAPTSFTFCQAASDMPVMWMNRLSGPSRCCCGRRRCPRRDRRGSGECRTARGCAPRSGGRAGARASRTPCGRVAEIDLAAHDHGDELVVGGEILLLEAGRILRDIGCRRRRRRSRSSRSAARRPVSSKRLHGRVGMLRRVVDLRDVEHRRDAGIELGEPAEQLADVDVLRPVVAGEAGRSGESGQDVLEIVLLRARRPRAVVDQDAVGDGAAYRRPGLVVVGVDEARHDDAAARVDLGGVARAKVGADRQDLLAFDEHVAFDEVADAPGRAGSIVIT